MNIADPKIPAVANPLLVGTGAVGRVTAACVMVGLFAASSLALAEPPHQDQRYQQRSERAAQQREDVRHFDQRAYEARAQEQRRRAQMDNNGPDRRGGLLTPDERRDLRRQINEAGMDIYPNTPRR